MNGKNNFIRTLNIGYRACNNRINIRQIAGQDSPVIPEMLPDTQDHLRGLPEWHRGNCFRPFHRKIER